jgi:hypothetical protein
MCANNMYSRPSRRYAVPVCLIGLLSALFAAGASGVGKTSQTFHAILREPLPPEELSVSTHAEEFVIKGPTFAYSVDQATGAINSLRVVRDRQEVLTTTGPADVQIDQYGLASPLNTCKVTLVSEGKDKVVVEASGTLRDPAQHSPEVDFTVAHTFFNDGVVVSRVSIIPRADLLVRSAVRYQVAAKGQFSSYLHKRRDEHGDSAVRGRLPESGQAVRWSSLTSCLEVFSVNAGKPVPWGPRVLHYTVAFKDKIWIMGGQTVPQFAAAEERFYRDVWNTSDGVHWKQITPREPCWTPRGLVGGSVVFKDRIWLLGGGTYDTPKAPQRKFYHDVWSSRDGVEWVCHVESAPWSPREYHDVAVFDDRMWVLEGYFEKGGNRNDVWHSQDGVNWEELPNTPWAPRHAASIFVHDNALWVVAGNNMESDVWKLTRKTSRP